MRILLDDQFYQHDQLPHKASTGIPVIILTRFNIRLLGAREKASLTDEEAFKGWCIKRSSIFINRCLPSVVGQTQKPDAWFLFFDKSYLDSVSPVLEAISKFSWIKPIIPTCDPKSLRKLCSDTCRLFLEEHGLKSDLVVTSRLDNDDSLGFGYVQALSEYTYFLERAGISAPYWISFSRGCQYYKDQLYDFPMPNNPFLSFTEKIDSFLTGSAYTAMFGNHGHVFRSPHKVYMPQSRYPMWLQYIHDGNVSNKHNKSLLCYRNPEDTMSRMFRVSPNH